MDQLVLKKEVQQTVIKAYMKKIILLWLLQVIVCSISIAQSNHGSNDNCEFYEFIDRVFKVKSNYKLDPDLISYDDILKRWEPEVEVKEILNFEFLNKSLLPVTLLDTVIDITDLEEVKMALDDCVRITRLNIKELKLKRKNLLIKDTRTDYKKSFPDFRTYKIAPPVFNYNCDFALIYIENYCGIECGGGQFNFYMRLSNGDWKYIGHVPVWVS